MTQFRETYFQKEGILFWLGKASKERQVSCIRQRRRSTTEMLQGGVSNLQALSGRSVSLIHVT